MPEGLVADLDLEPANPEVKQYHRLKLRAIVISTMLAFGWMAVLAILLGPELGRAFKEYVSANLWLRLLLVACVLGVGLEMLTLPIDYWSSFVLEHRYQLSTQTLAG